jgi:hypothetical protein
MRTLEAAMGTSLGTMGIHTGNMGTPAVVVRTFATGMGRVAPIVLARLATM